MTNSNIAKVPRFTTPVGIANYPWLVEPDTKFDPEGVYKVNMVFGERDPHLDYILKDLDKMLDEYYEAIKTDPKYAKVASKIQKADLYEEDDDGNIVIKFKQRAKIKSVKGTFDVKIPIFDSKGKPLTEVKLGGGSKIKLCFSASPYYVPSTRMCGLSLRPVAVQLIELKEWGDPNSMESYGFETEDGYVKPEECEEQFFDDHLPDELGEDYDDPSEGADRF